MAGLAVAAAAYALLAHAWVRGDAVIVSAALMVSAVACKENLLPF